MTDKTQALLPVTVTQSDREAAADLIEQYWQGAGEQHDQMRKTAASYRAGHTQGVWAVAFARHRISHSLPGDVGTDADAQRNIVRAVIDCYNTSRPAGLSPVEYVQSKRLVRDAFASLSSVPVQIEQDELLDLIDDAISDSFDEEWNSRMGARHIVGALEHEGWAVVPLAALTPSPCPGEGRGHWLIERRCSPPQWSIEPRPTGIGAFYSDIHRAHRFSSKEEASEAMRNMSITTAERSEYFVSEHIWVAGGEVE